jgi:hypothetical protein
MDILGICVKESNDEREDLLAQSIKRFKIKCIQIRNNNETGTEIKKSINEKYAIAVKVLNDQNQIKDDTIILFCHDDINILDNFFLEKIKYVFEQKSEIGVVGVIGTEEIHKDSFWLDDKNKYHGHMILNEKHEKTGKGEHSIFGDIGFFTDIVNIDNSFFAVRGSLLNKNDFDFGLDVMMNDNYFYASNVCIQSLLKGFKVAVADILIYHNSDSKPNVGVEYMECRRKFFEKYSDIEFPITINSFDIDKSEVMEISL